MAHPILEALYIGLLTSGLSQPVDVPRTLVAPLPASTAVSMPARPRVVYDWAAGQRIVYTGGVSGRKGSSQPLVGNADEQVRRIVSDPLS